MTSADLPGKRGRTDKTGGREFIHSMVTTGSISFTDGNLVERQEELVFPPRQMTSTSSAHVGSALVQNLELYLMGQGLAGGIDQLARNFRAIGFFSVADSAKSNLKTVRQLFAFLSATGKNAGAVVTCSFLPCFLHQLMRLVLLLAEHKGISSPLFSVTRLQLSSTLRQRTCRTMRSLLDSRFRFFADTRPPGQRPTDSYFRARLRDLITNSLENVIEDDEETFQAKASHVAKLIDFFNGDITNKLEWQHYCTGCHSNRAHALNDVPFLAIRHGLDMEHSE